ncbi:MAG TPA: CBS domain-containing protein [Steroidobacteraceae bacterium]|nr:CBS domain-containing protein [Steroidobacteraceae bacterium]
MNLKSIMTARVVTVELDDPLSVVKQIFDSAKFHHLLVVDHGRLCGVISDRDLLRALSPYVGTVSETARDSATLKKRVHQIMSRKPVTLPPEATIPEAIQVMLEHGVSCIPVVDANFKPIGIVSWRDLLKKMIAPTP